MDISTNYVVKAALKKPDERSQYDRSRYEILFHERNCFIFEARVKFRSSSGKFLYFDDVDDPDFNYSFGVRGTERLFKGIHAKTIRQDIEGYLIGEFTFYNASGRLHIMPANTGSEDE